jgi:hypothetical protein
VWGSYIPPPSRPPCHTIPAMVPSGHVQPQRCTGQTSHPYDQNRQIFGIPRQGRTTAVDGPKTHISGQGHRRYPYHPPWHLPPGVCLRSSDRLLQGHAIGRAAGRSGHEMGISRPFHGPISLQQDPSRLGTWPGGFWQGKACRDAMQESSGMTRPVMSALPVERSGNRSGSRAVLTPTTNAGHVENMKKSEAEQGSWFRY